MLTTEEVWVNAGYAKTDESDTSALCIAAILICGGLVSFAYFWINPM